MRIVKTTGYQDPGYIVRILIALDELGAALLDMSNDVTISSWCDLHQKDRLLGRFGHWALDKIQYRHCELAIENDLGRADVAKAELGGDINDTLYVPPGVTK